MVFGFDTMTVLGAASAAASVAGTAVSVMGAEAQGQAQSEQEQYNAQVAQNNSILAQRAATEAVQQGQQDATNRAIAGNERLSAEKDTLAGNDNPALPGTSALQLVAGSAQQNEVNNATVTANAQNQADNFIAQSNNFNAAAAQDQIASTAASNSATTSALADTASGVGTVASKWYTYKQDGVF